MRIKFIVFFIVFLFCVGAYVFDQFQQQKPHKAIGASASSIVPEHSSGIEQSPLPAPQISFLTLKGESFNSFDDMQEPLIFINFWASWCAPCIAELPDMIEMIKNLQGQAALVTIAQDDDVQAAKNFMKKIINPQKPPKNTYWVWDEEKKISQTFNVLKVPETIILNSKRHMIQKIVGAQEWDYQEWKPLLSEITQ